MPGPSHLVEYYKVNNKNTVKTDKTYLNCLEDAFVRAKSMSYLSFFTELRRLTKTITKLMPSINELSVSIYRSIPRTKTNVVRGGFD